MEITRPSGGRLIFAALFAIGTWVLFHKFIDGYILESEWGKAIFPRAAAVHNLLPLFAAAAVGVGYAFPAVGIGAPILLGFLFIYQKALQQISDRMDTALLIPICLMAVAGILSSIIAASLGSKTSHH